MAEESDRKKCRKHAEAIQTGRTLAASNQVAKAIRYNLHPEYQSPLTQVWVSNVERGYRSGLQRKCERNTKDLCLLHAEMRFQLKGYRGHSRESYNVSSSGSGTIVLEYNVTIPASCS